MPGITWKEGGEEWQRHIVVLLKRKHGYDFAEIPDSDGGDYGLEGFTYSGYAYQCYAVEEPVEHDVRYRRQRDKITRDITKFINNSDGLLKLLGTTKISHWLFVVPYWNTKKLQDHAEKKAQEVRELNLPYVAENFHINIIDRDYFAVELAQLHDSGLTKERVDPDDLPADACSIFADGNNEMIANLERKINLLAPRNFSHEKKEKLKMDFINHYISGQNVLDNLKSKYPDLHVKALKTKEDRERFLSVETSISSSTPAEIFNDTMRQYTDELTNELKGLRPQTVNILAYEAISYWLLRCPLDFSDYEDYI
ncbi:hypothetical protein [Methanococcoides sp. AM1]|uniref:hypothetical protein n=1 Tax=Methanococcoides sp. AM1 TaxID=1201011 RepID=UPI0010826CCD|nr:hypothetical protein [Methanococcoides sp. AM1]